MAFWAAAAPILKAAAPYAAGVASIIGGVGQNQSAEGMSAKQMAFQERMRDTAHQAEVRDLRAAGLNPILSANKGAATPAGSAAPVKNVLENAASTALSVQRSNAEIAKINAETVTAQKTAQNTEQATAESKAREANQIITNQKLINELPATERRELLERTILAPIQDAAEGVSSAYDKLKSGKSLRTPIHQLGRDSRKWITNSWKNIWKSTK